MQLIIHPKLRQDMELHYYEKLFDFSKIGITETVNILDIINVTAIKWTKL